MALEFRRTADGEKDVIRHMMMGANFETLLGSIESHDGIKRFIVRTMEVATLDELKEIVAELEKLEELMKPIDDYQIGDRVVMQMTGATTALAGECISTRHQPTKGTPKHDHPRFKTPSGDILTSL